VRVAITRPKERSGETEEIVRKRGWDAVIVPSIEIIPIPIDPSVLLTDYDWLVVTSASAVDILWKRFGDALNQINVAVVGPKTRSAFEKKGISTKVVASESVGEGLARELSKRVIGKKVLVTRAASARKELVVMLKEIASITEIAIYDSVPPTDKTGMERFKKMLDLGGIDALIFTSSLAARNLIDFVGEALRSRLNEIIICAIGPITAATLEELGIKPACMPEVYTIDAALDEISKHVST
jgi:uroporphyrinogen-III synthase